MNEAGFDDGDWQRISGYLDQALDLDPQAHAGWLEALANTDPRIAQTLHALLAEREILNSNGYLEPALSSTGVRS